MNATLEKLLGPRVPAQEARRSLYLLPSLLLALAALCLLASVLFPYWRMTLLAPQYPGGLHVYAYVNRLTGDVQEVDGLNHYIGMRPLEDAARLERSLSVAAAVALSLLVLAAIFVHNRWAALLALPAALYPFVFLGDLYLWLRFYGQNLDPTAPLSGAIKPFVPPLLGVGVVGQFRTVAWVDVGFYLATLASALVLAGLYFHRRAYKPLVEARARSGR